MNGLPRFADVEALAYAIVRALEDRDSGLIAEIKVLRQEIASLCEEVANLGHLLVRESDRSAAPAALQDAIRSDLARLIERLNSQSRADQVVALREEVRAQIGALAQADELRSLRLLISTELARLRLPAGPGADDS
jgi:hypothetical protein